MDVPVKGARRVLVVGAVLAAGALLAWGRGGGDRGSPAIAARGAARPAGAAEAAVGVRAARPEGAAPAPALSDPDGVGECPGRYAGIPVVRRGLDALGRPSWWHEDGSVTVRAVQRVRQGGEVLELPVVVHATPR